MCVLSLTVRHQFCGYWFSILFLSQALTIMLVYIWGQRNRSVRMNFLFMVFRAPMLPWVLLVFSLLLGGSVWVDVLGKIVPCALPLFASFFLCYWCPG